MAIKPKIYRGLSKRIKNPVTLGDRIRNKRIELGLYQKEVAHIIGVSEDCIANWEKNRSKPLERFKKDIRGFLLYKSS